MNKETSTESSSTPETPRKHNVEFILHDDHFASKEDADHALQVSMGIMLRAATYLGGKLTIEFTGRDHPKPLANRPGRKSSTIR